MAEHRTVVTLGPTLPAATAARLLPHAEIRPPVQAGEVTTFGLGAGDVLLIIDGFFLQSRAVRHKEILDLLDQGVTVLGASSMGALRAAELDGYGMRGLGAVYRAYRRGRLVGDDEVALVHADADNGYRAVGWALVDLRDAVRTAVSAGVLTAADARTVVAVAEQMPFTGRSTAAVLAGARARGVCGERLARFRAACGRPSGWVKYRDATHALSVVRAMRRTPGGPARAGRLRWHGRPVVRARTSYATLWQPVCPARANTAAYTAFVRTAVAHPDFPDVYRRIAGECLLLAADGPGTRPGLAAGRDWLARRYGLRAEPDGLLGWSGVVAALGPRLARLGLPSQVSDVPAGLRELLRESERRPDDPAAAVLLATRLWRADPRSDWLAPMTERLDAADLLVDVAGDAEQPEADPRAGTAELLAGWGVRSRADVLPAVRERGLVDVAELVRAVRAGLVAATAPPPAPRAPAVVGAPSGTEEGP